MSNLKWIEALLLEHNNIMKMGIGRMTNKNDGDNHQVGVESKV